MNVSLTLLDGREGGATFRPDGAPVPTEGWAVSRKGGRVYPLDDFFGGTHQLVYLASFIAEHLDQLAADPQLYVGTWVNEGQVYLDLTTVFPRSELALAVAFGMMHEQAAMYCLHDQTTWYLNTEAGWRAAAQHAQQHDLVGGVVYGPVIGDLYIATKFVVAQPEEVVHG